MHQGVKTHRADTIYRRPSGRVMACLGFCCQRLITPIGNSCTSVGRPPATFQAACDPAETIHYRKRQQLRNLAIISAAIFKSSMSGRIFNFTLQAIGGPLRCFQRRYANFCIGPPDGLTGSLKESGNHAERPPSCLLRRRQRNGLVLAS
jgi:hypothetical protein